MRSTWNSDQPAQKRQWTGTLAIVVGIVALFLLGWFLSGSTPNPVWETLGYTDGLDKPWTLLTYPFSNPLAGVMLFAFGCWVLYQYLGDLERQLGRYGTIIFFFAVTLIGGIGYAIGSGIAGRPSPNLPDLWLPMQVVIFTWAARNWKGSISLFGVIQMSCKALGYISIAAIVVYYGWTVPIVGLFAALPIPFVWFYATGRVQVMNFGKAPDVSAAKQVKRDTKEFDEYMDKVRGREMDREEQEKLRSLFEQSISDDDIEKD